MSDLVIQSLALALQPKAQALLMNARSAGLDPFVAKNGGVRTAAEQFALFAKGRHHDETGRWAFDDPLHHVGVVTNALPEDSPHCHGGAIDVLLLERGKVLTMTDCDPPEIARQLRKYCWLGQLGEDLGLAWGGRWRSLKDYPHFELPAWRSLPVIS